MPDTFDWHNAFAHEWHELLDGKVDHEGLAPWVAELYETYGKRDPVEVARELFAMNPDA